MVLYTDRSQPPPKAGHWTETDRFQFVDRGYRTEVIHSGSDQICDSRYKKMWQVRTGEA